MLFVLVEVSDISVEYATFVGGDHILDVDEGIFSSVELEHLESLLNEITKVCCLSLAVVNLVSQVLVLDLEEVHHGEDLTVVGDKCLTDGVRASHKCLEDLKSD